MTRAELLIFNLSYILVLLLGYKAGTGIQNLQAFREAFKKKRQKKVKIFNFRGGGGKNDQTFYFLKTVLGHSESF